MKVNIFLVILAVVFLTENSGIVLAESNKVDSEQLEKMLSEIKQGQGNKIEKVVNMGDTVIPVLIKKAREEDWRTRRMALELLSRIDKKDDEILNKEEIIETMSEALEDKEQRVVNEALRSLLYVDAKKVKKKTIDKLIRQLDKGQGKAARILGNVGDASLIPVLEKYLGKNVGMTINVRQALARLGEKKYFDEIVSELESKDYSVRVNAIRNLGYIGSKAAVKKISEFLYNQENPQAKAHDVILSPYRFIAATSLQKIVENPPVKKWDALYTEDDVQLWREWWEKNKHKYGGE